MSFIRNNEQSQKIPGNLLLMTIMVLEWLALPTQFYLLINTGQFTWAEAVVRFFSFFTILTNFMVALCATILLFGKSSTAYEFVHKKTTLTAVTVYILIVGIVYNIMLRPLHQLQGLHSIITEIFHSVVPLLFLLYWLLFLPQERIPWKNIIMWQVYPLLYVFYTLLHGWYTHFYPYPFIDVNKLGFNRAMTNGLFVLLAFVVLSAILTTINNWRVK